MVTLLLGPYGHGKSTYIIDKIKEDYEHGVRSFLIVPEQQTVISERQLTEALPPMAQLYTEATNLTRLANSVFRKTGGLRYNYITASGKSLIMYRALCEARDILQQYKIPKGREKSCVKLFLQAIGELKSYGIDIPELEKAASQVESPSLKNKLEDIIVVWAVYEKILLEKYDDPYDDLLMLEKKLGECEFFKGCNVYFDSFYGFTKSQLDVVYKIIEGAQNVTFALDCPQDADTDTMQYAKIAGTKNKIISICKKLKQDILTVPFETDYKHQSEEIRYICDKLWSFEAEPTQSRGGITLALAGDEFNECEFVCTKIKELILGGCKYSDIAIIARNPSTYQGIIDFCLDKYDIPYYFSIPSKITSKPIIKMIFSALNAIGGFQAEDIISYAKCGYTDIPDEDLCLLERYIYKWSIYGNKFKNDDFWASNPDGYIDHPTNAQLEELEVVLRTRDKLLSLLAILEKPFMTGGDVKACATGLYNFLEAHRVHKKLQNEIAKADSDEAQELSQIWGALIYSLDLIVDICADTVCDTDTFATLLSYAMMDTHIGTIPTGEDKVTVAEASLVRAKNIDHVFVLGANEGVFPALVNDDSFFTDSDKVELETLEISLSARTDERGDDELLFFKNSIAVAARTATVSALKKDINGKICEESIGFSRLKALLDGVKIVDAAQCRTVDKIYTPKMANELFGSADAELRLAITELTEPTVKKPAFENENEEVSTETAERIFGNRLYLSKSRLEKFAKCRFDYYCSNVLKLRDNEKIKFTHSDIGNLIHAIFEHFLKLYKAQRQDYSDAEIYETVTRLTNEYTAKVCGARALSNKMKHFFDRLKGTACVFVRAILDEMKNSRFTPEYFELSITGDGISSPTPLEFKINDSCSVVMTGVADRIDICRSDDTAYVRIFDYKTGNYDFKLSNLKNGLDMQMLIYLLAICNMDECQFKNKLLGFAERIEPAGFVFLSYRIDKTEADKEVDLTSEAALSNEVAAIEGKISRSGLEINSPLVISEDKRFNLSKNSYIEADDFKDIFELVKNSVTSIGLDMLSGNAKAQPLEGENPCKYCKNGAVCRRRQVK